MVVALGTGMDPMEISFAGPGKSPAEIERAVAAGVTVTLESPTEMQRAVSAGDRLGITPRVAVRVNPDFELRSSGMKMSGGPKQFGIDAETVPEVLERIGVSGLDFDGFHIFCGSQNLREEAIAEAQEKTVDLALRLSGAAPKEPRFINIGGGFGIPYFPGDKPINLEAIGESLAVHVDRVADELPNSRVVIELGRYIVGEAGIYVCRVLDRKVSRGHVFLVTDGGLHHHLAASGNFGQVLRKNYPLVIGNRVYAETTEPQSVVGPLCTPLDLLGASMELPPGQVDDLVVLFQSGAYGLTASPTAFLSHPEPGEILL
jgi:diaminopimelate decarboxylase